MENNQFLSSFCELTVASSDEERTYPKGPDIFKDPRSPRTLPRRPANFMTRFGHPIDNLETTSSADPPTKSNPKKAAINGLHARLAPPCRTHTAASRTAAPAGPTAQRPKPMPSVEEEHHANEEKHILPDQACEELNAAHHDQTTTTDCNTVQSVVPLTCAAETQPANIAEAMAVFTKRPPRRSRLQSRRKMLLRQQPDDGKRNTACQWHRATTTTVPASSGHRAGPFAMADSRV